MKKAGLNQYTPLKARKPLNRYSLKRIEQLNAEVPAREVLCRQADGRAFYYDTVATVSGKHVIIKHLVCLNAICQNCGKRVSEIEPHEKVKRSAGGHVTVTNSILVCRECHNEQHGKPMWSKNREVIK